MSEDENHVRVPNHALRLASIYASRFNVVIGADGMARITFGTDNDFEMIDYHVAISMTNGNLEALYATIGALIVEVTTKNRPPKARMS